MNWRKRNRILPFAGLTLLFAAGTVHAQTFSVLYQFGAVSGAPLEPPAPLAQGVDGALYGTAGGGANNDIYGNPYGSIYKLNSTGKISVVYSFCAKSGCPDGFSPFAGLTLRSDGHFLGSATEGGTYNAGTLFDISATGTFTLLYSFTGGADGATPYTPLILSPDGNFYGAALAGGRTSKCGTAYRLTPALTGISAMFTLLHKFGRVLEGCNPVSLVLGTDGNLYGVLKWGGSTGFGSVFKMTHKGVVTLLHNFSGLADGSYPTSLTLGSDGNFYGTALGPAQTGPSVIFKITSGGAFTVLHTANGDDGNNLYGALFQASDGNFYGAAMLGGTSTNAACLVYAGITGCGTLFRITPAGDFTVLYDFDFTTGFAPISGPFQHTSGVLYGVTEFGGSYDDGGYCFPKNCGVLYRLNDDLPPYAALVPAQAKTGTAVEILGQGFTSSTTVSFNGMPAKEVIVSSPTSLIAKVPTSATSGYVTVTTPNVTLTSNQPFIVAP